MNLINAIRAAGHEIIVFSPTGAEVESIEALGIRHVHLSLDPKGTNPLKEIRAIFSLRHMLHIHNVNIVLSSTPKGNLYTALARINTHRLQIANVSGLGSSYLRENWLSKLVNALYSLTFKKIDYVFFENPTDFTDFIQRNWVDAKKSEKIPGLGVDLQHFSPSPWPIATAGEIRFLMIARLIGDKGVREYVDAARIVRNRYRQAHFTLLGDSAADNPTSIPTEEISRWNSEKNIEHIDYIDDVRPYISAAHCLVLPSYREGMSRTLLEGGALGRPLIASDVPGCREAITTDVNGLLCAARSAASLAEQLNRFISMSENQRRAMGAASRQKISSEFDERYVIQRYLDVLASITANLEK